MSVRYFDTHLKVDVVSSTFLGDGPVDYDSTVLVYKDRCRDEERIEIIGSGSFLLTDLEEIVEWSRKQYTGEVDDGR